MSTGKNPSTRFRPLLFTGLLLAILAAPSLWMLAKIPPLWRDTDAYAQVAHPAGVATILHYGPLYCWTARVPLFLGYAFEAWQTGAALPSLAYFQSPILSDTGVYFLLVLQHAGLWAASLYVITTASRSFPIRFSLTALWAVNPLFNTFAHCVGSETLSLILSLLLAAKGLALTRRAPRPRDWLAFGLLLALCILTRHLNAVLAALLPIAFAFSSAVPLTTGKREGDNATKFLQRAGLAIAVGISAIALATGTMRALSHLAGIPYRSRIGYTFLWRLKFLNAVPPEVRDAILERKQQETNSPDTRLFLDAVREQFRSGELGDLGRFINAAGKRFPAGDPARAAARFDHALNNTARAFVRSPPPEYLAAVKKDFVRGWGLAIPNVLKNLFGSTAFYFSHSDMMPGCASLVTFRESSAEKIDREYRRRFFRRHANFSYRTVFLVWALGLLAVTGLSLAGRAERPSTIPYALALTVIGLLTTLANLSLSEFMARFTLPMWEFTIVSATILFAALGDFFLSRPPRVPFLD